MKLNLNLASRRSMNKRALDQGFWVVLCLLLLLCGWSVHNLKSGYSSLQQNRHHLLAAEKQLQNLRGGPTKPLSAAERVALEKEFSEVKELLTQNAFRWTKLLDRMEKILPNGVNLRGFRPDYEKKSLALDGRARSLKKMRIFLDRLLTNDSFKQVYLKKHSRIIVRDYAGTEHKAIAFSIQLVGVF